MFEYLNDREKRLEELLKEAIPDGSLEPKVITLEYRKPNYNKSRNAFLNNCLLQYKINVAHHYIEERKRDLLDYIARGFCGRTIAIGEFVQPPNEYELEWIKDFKEKQERKDD